MEHGDTFKWMKPRSDQLPRVGGEHKDELLNDLPFEEYLSDKDRISSSQLRRILDSPKHFVAEAMGFFENDEEKEKDHYRFGRAAHMMVLEPDKFRQLYLIEPEFLGPTKDGKKMSSQSEAAKEKRKQWWASVPKDAVVLKEKELSELTYMVEALMGHRQASNMLTSGKPEVTGRFQDKETGIWCRIRPDYLTFGGNGELYITDLKTSRDISEGLFSTDVARFKYHLQLAFYADGIAQITGQAIEAVSIIAMEKKPPFDVAVYWIDEDDLAKGRQWYKYALNVYKRCVESNEWPGRQADAQILRLPKWTNSEEFPTFQWRK